MTRCTSTASALVLVLPLMFPPTGAAETMHPMAQLAVSRMTGNSLMSPMEALATTAPALCACALGQLQREAPWPHETFHRNEEVREGLTARMAALGIAPDAACTVTWEEYVPDAVPPEAQAHDFLDELSPADKQRLLMHLALYGPADEVQVTRLMGLGESEQDPRAQELALMAAARLLARSPGTMDATAGALLELLRQRGSTQNYGDLGYTVAIAGVLASSRSRIAELLLAQYDPADDQPREWVLRVWSETDFRRLDRSQRRRIIDALIAASPDGEYLWLESSILSHIEALTGDVYPVVTEMMDSDDEVRRLCGIRWAAASQVRPDEMAPRYIEHYRTDTPEARAMALWGFACVIGARESYADAAPLLPDVLNDLHHPTADLRQQAATLLQKLISKECHSPGRYEGLDAIQPALLDQLTTGDAEHRQRVVDMVRPLRSECLSRELSRALQGR